MKTLERALFGAILLGLLVAFTRGAGARPQEHVAAPADSSGPRTLEHYLALAREANPSVKAASARARAVKEHAGVARGFPDPSLEYGYYVSPDAMQGRQELILRQEIPFPGKRGLRGEIAAREAGRALRTAQAMVLDLDYAVKTSFFEFVRTSEVARVLAEERDVVSHMREISLSRYSSGTAEQSEVLKLDVAIAQINDQITMNQHDEDKITAQLNQLINRDPMRALPAPDWKVPKTEDLETAARLDSALVRRPEIASARVDLEAANISKQLARREYFPDFMLGFDWEFGGGQDAIGNRMEDSWEIMAGVTLPIWLGKRRAMSRAADAMRESAEYGLEATTNDVARDLEVSIHGVRAARDRLNRFDSEILPRAEQAFKSAEAGYRAGRVDFLAYLDSERMLLAMRREYFGVISELGAETAALERALGERGR